MKILHPRTTSVWQRGLTKYKFSHVTENGNKTLRCQFSHIASPCHSSSTGSKPLTLTALSYGRGPISRALSFTSNRPLCTNCAFLCNQNHWLGVTRTIPAICVMQNSMNRKSRWKQSYVVEVQRECSISSDSVEQGQQQPWKILFFGSDHFSLTCLHSLDQDRRTSGLIQQLDVVVPQSKYIRRAGKKESWVVSPVLQYAQENGLKIHHWPVDDKVKDYDVGVVASFGRLIPSKVIKHFPQGVLNVHPSLLPKWRGAAPIIHTILNNDTETGVTIMRLKPKRFDVGPILLQKAVSIPRDCTAESLHQMLAKAGADMLLEVLGDLPNFIKNEKPQTEDGGASYGGKISSDHALVDWSKSLQHIHRQYRAISILMPLHTRWKGQHVILRNMGDPREISDLLTKCPGATPGQLCYHKEADLLCIRCMDGWVGFQYVTIALRQKLSAKDFYNGYLSGAKAKTEHFSC